MTAILEFFGSIGEKVSMLFSVIGSIFDFLAHIPRSVSNLIEALRYFDNIFPSEMLAFLIAGIAFIVTIAILKYVWIGGDPE